MQSKVDVTYMPSVPESVLFGDLAPRAFFSFAPHSGRTAGGLRMRLSGLGYTLVDPGRNDPFTTAQVGDILHAGGHTAVIPIDVKIIVSPRGTTP